MAPREDLFVEGLNDDESPVVENTSIDAVLADDETRATQILKDLDAYVPATPAPAVTHRSDPTDDAIIIIGVLLIATAFGGFVGWFAGAPLIHDFFQSTLGVESDGPEAFRRLGAFVGAMVSLLFGAFVGTLIRR